MKTTFDDFPFMNVYYKKQLYQQSILKPMKWLIFQLKNGNVWMINFSGKGGIQSFLIKKKVRFTKYYEFNQISISLSWINKQIISNEFIALVMNALYSIQIQFW